MTRPRLSRRNLAHLLAVLVSIPRRAWPQAVDQGIGGTGVVGDPKDESDQTIGGTGVVGTIRRFGSIYVNELRITTPDDLRVSTDLLGSDGVLKIGHVVRAAATGTQDALVARSIAVVHEVIGPIEAVAAGRLTVLGQTVSLPKGLRSPDLRRGEAVAISGLRRLDGTVVASLIESAPASPSQVAGPLVRSLDGSLTIGRLSLAGIDPTLVGQRVTVVGRQRGNILAVEHVATERALLVRLGTVRWSIEGYVGHDAGGLRFGSGLQVAGAGTEATSGDLSVVDVVLDPRERLTVETVAVESQAKPADQQTRGLKATGDKGGSKHSGGSPSGGRGGAGGRR